MLDGTESPINRPKTNQKEYYSGKKNATVKTQIVIERNSLKIIDADEAKGSEHDFKIYKDTIGKSVSNSISIDADLGYLGIEAYHSNSFIPIKSSKNRQQTKREKAYNKRLARRRVVIERINCRIKVFRCMSYRSPCPVSTATTAESSLTIRFLIGASRIMLRLQGRAPIAKMIICFVEQKNGDVARKTVGYARFEGQDALNALAQVYHFLNPLLNYWYPTLRLIAKEKFPSGRYKKIYEKEAKTPY